jgi:predicted amidohydrolase
MRVGVVQLCSSDDVEANLVAAEAGVAEAAGLGARFVALPEMHAYLRREGSTLTCVQELDGAIVRAAQGWARKHEVRLLAGSFPERAEDGDRVYNTSVLLSPRGEVEAVYRKIHLFDVDLGDAGGGRFRESARFSAGEACVVAQTPEGGIGLSICYDVRFPELYRQQAAQDARFLAVPSAFSPHTGKDHWELLLRARAIENLAFVVAPAQCGQNSPERASYGRSMIIDPWGVVLAQLGDDPGVAVAECDLAQQDRMRRQLPALGHRRL